MFYIWDPTIIILIPGIILALWAQFKVQGTYAKYSKVPAKNGMTGAQIAAALLRDKRIDDVSIEPVPGNLTDHYDPRSKVLRLSQGVYNSNSLAAIAVAAHETGHAVQHHTYYYPLQLRSLLYPVSSFGSMMAFPLFLIGLLFHSGVMLQIGIMLFLLAVAFTVITLPVEFNASSRALVMLKEGGYLTEEELPHARKVLTAAAMTYVAATVMALLQLLRLLVLAQDRE